MILFKNSRKFLFKTASIISISFLMLVSVYAVEVNNDGLLHKKVQLFTGSPKNPYTMFFPIEVTKPGRVLFNIKTLNYSSKDFRDRKDSARAFRWYFVDSRFFDKNKPMKKSKFQQLIDNVNQYNPAEYVAGDEIRSFSKHISRAVRSILGKKKKREPMPEYFRRGGPVLLSDSRGSYITHYDIDQIELGQTQGMYFIIVQNLREKITPEFEVKVSFPGVQKNVDKDLIPKPKKPDLAIKSVKYDKNTNSFRIAIINEGGIKLNKELYQQKAKNSVKIIAKLGDKQIFSTKLAVIDPNQKLVKPGVMIWYTAKLIHTEFKSGDRVIFNLRAPDLREITKRNNTKGIRIR